MSKIHKTTMINDAKRYAAYAYLDGRFDGEKVFYVHHTGDRPVACGEENFSINAGFKVEVKININPEFLTNRWAERLDASARIIDKQDN